MTAPLIEAFELVVHSEQLAPRLDAAAAELAKRPGLAEEKAWLETARQRVAPTREGTGDLLVRVLRLPELEPVKAERTRMLQGAVVDALEHLHAAITFAGGPRTPLLEALYFKLKMPVLRRCDRDELERFYADFEKRLSASYTKRMLADETYAPVGPALRAFHAAFATWKSVFVAEPLAEGDAQALRDELLAAARGLEVPCRQARLLAQAALAPLKELAESAALMQRAKRKGARASEDDETHPVLEQDPPDPSEPTPDERAELSAVQASEARRPDAPS
jgi:hypothetical protein